MNGFNKKYLQVFAVIISGVMTVATMQCSKIEHLQAVEPMPEKLKREALF